MCNIFEKPWLLLIIAIVAFLIVFIFRVIKPEKKQRWQLAIPIIIAVLAFAIDAFIKTDLENIDGIIKSCITASKNEDADTIEAFIAPDYQDSLHQDKEEVMMYCRAILSEPAVKRFIILDQSTEILSSNATVIINGYLFFDEKSRFYKELKPAMAIKFELDMKKYPPKKWQINCLEILEIDKQTINWDNLLEIDRKL